MTDKFVHSNVALGENGHLTFAGVDTVELAEEYSTPSLFVDEDRVRSRCREYVSAMKKYLPVGSFPLFASKALSFKEIYRVVGSEGMGTDIVSSGELFTAATAGFDMSRAFFHGNNKTDFDIKYAIKSGIGYFIADGEEELYCIDAAAKNAGVTQKILLRLTPGIDPHTHKKISTGGVDSKFGSAIGTGLAERITKLALSLGNVELCGFHCHIGSQIFETEPYIAAVDIMTDFIAKMKEKYGYEPKYLNLGGGFGVRYVEKDPVISYEENLKVLSDAIKLICKAEKVKMPDIYVEPGRSIVADSGITLYTTQGVKSITGYKNYVSVDGGMTDNPRYTLYQSAYTVINASKAAQPADFCATLAGCCCESGDLIGEDMKFARPDEEDVIAVLTTGAYNYSMASNYNRVARPPIVAIKGGKDRLVVRRESLDDLIKNDI